MSFLDFLILNFAIGAPFGALYFFNNRKSRSPMLLFVITIGVLVFWFFYAFSLIARSWNKKINKTRVLKESAVQNPDKNGIVLNIQTDIEKLLAKYKSNVTIYEFREVAERYIGLTLTNQVPNDNTIATESRIGVLEFSKTDDFKIAAACVSRRNNELLSFHRNNARQELVDFLRSINLPPDSAGLLDTLSGRMIAAVENPKQNDESAIIKGDLAHSPAERFSHSPIPWKTGTNLTLIDRR